MPQTIANTKTIILNNMGDFLGGFMMGVSCDPNKEEKEENQDVNE